MSKRSVRAWFGLAVAPAWIVWAAGSGDVMAITTDASPTPSAASSPRLSSPSPASPPRVVQSASSGPPTTQVTLTGSGFPPGETVAEYIDAPPVYQSTLVDSSGNFIAYVSMDGSPIGSHQICADTGFPGSSQPVAVKVCNPFTSLPFQPGVTLSVSSGMPGTPLTITMTGFPPDQGVAVYIDVQNPAAGIPQPFFFGTPGQLNAQGLLIEPVSWPTTPSLITQPGAYPVCADTGSQWAGGTYAAKACAQFTVEGSAPSTPSATPSLVPSPSPTPTILASPAATNSLRPGPPLPALLAGTALLIVAAGAVALWLMRTRRTKTRGI